MIFKQHYLGCLAHASYLVADEASRHAAIIDPQRDIEMYLDDAREHSLDIRYAVLTHLHADFIAGHLELREKTGAEIVLGARAEAEYDFRPLGDGDAIELGSVRLRALETPGHSPESISLLVFDLEDSPDEPTAVLTGDTLFIGDVGRPDLRAALGWSSSDLAEMLYYSLHDKLMSLPDATLVYPAHGAGSLCGNNLSSETVSTIGVQGQYNYALQPMSKRDFLRIVTAEQPEAPEYFTYDAVLNSKERPTLDQTMDKAVAPLSLETVLEFASSGAQILDTRPPIDFAAVHLNGSINIPLSGKYATWAGTLLDPSESIVIVADVGSESESVMRLGRIGFDRIAGYLADGMQVLDGRRDLTGSIERITVGNLSEELLLDDAPFVLDVRSETEWAEDRIAGSCNVPLTQLRARIEEIPKGVRLVAQCRTEYRSSVAASILAQRGYDNMLDLVGGIEAWHAAGFQTVNDPSST